MGLLEEIQEIKDKIRKQEEEQKLKKEKEWNFKFPFGKKVGNSQKKRNFVTVIELLENSGMKFHKLQIEDQTIVIDSIPRLASAGCIFYYKKNPTIVLPSWSVEPLSASKHFSQSLDNGTNVNGYKIILASMKKSIVTGKKQMTGWLKWVVGIGLAAIIGYALISGGGK